MISGECDWKEVCNEEQMPVIRGSGGKRDEGRSEDRVPVTT